MALLDFNDFNMADASPAYANLLGTGRTVQDKEARAYSRLQEKLAKFSPDIITGIDDADTIMTARLGTTRSSSNPNTSYDAVETPHAAGTIYKDSPQVGAMEGAITNKYKKDIQLAQVSAITGKPVSELTEQDFIDVSNMQTIQKTADLARLEHEAKWTAPYVKGVEQVNLSGHYVDDKGQDVSIPLNIPTRSRNEGVGYYGRPLTEFANANDDFVTRDSEKNLRENAALFKGANYDDVVLKEAPTKEEELGDEFDVGNTAAGFASGFANLSSRGAELVGSSMKSLGEEIAESSKKDVKKHNWDNVEAGILTPYIEKFGKWVGDGLTSMGADIEREQQDWREGGKFDEMVGYDASQVQRYGAKFADNVENGNYIDAVIDLADPIAITAFAQSLPEMIVMANPYGLGAIVAANTNANLNELVKDKPDATAEDKAISVGLSVVGTLIDRLGDKAVLSTSIGKLPGAVKDAVQNKYGKTLLTLGVPVAVFAGKSAFEGATEGVQTIMEGKAKDASKHNLNLTKEEKREALEATGIGAGAGGVPAAGSVALEGAKAVKKAIPEGTGARVRAKAEQGIKKVGEAATKTVDTAKSIKDNLAPGEDAAGGSETISVLNEAEQEFSTLKKEKKIEADKLLGELKGLDESSPRAKEIELGLKGIFDELTEAEKKLDATEAKPTGHTQDVDEGLKTFDEDIVNVTEYLTKPVKDATKAAEMLKSAGLDVDTDKEGKLVGSINTEATRLIEQLVQRKDEIKAADVDNKSPKAIAKMEEQIANLNAATTAQSVTELDAILSEDKIKAPEKVRQVLGSAAATEAQVNAVLESTKDSDEITATDRKLLETKAKLLKTTDEVGAEVMFGGGDKPGIMQWMGMLQTDGMTAAVKEKIDFFVNSQNVKLKAFDDASIAYDEAVDQARADGKSAAEIDKITVPVDHMNPLTKKKDMYYGGAARRKLHQDIKAENVLLKGLQDVANNMSGSTATVDQKQGKEPETKTEQPVTPKEPKTAQMPSDAADLEWTALQYDEDTGKTTRTSGKSNVIEIAGRPVVVRVINGVRVPFYISTGNGGKKGVAAGKWYPFFGLGKDQGWFNKGSEQDINSYYGSPEIKKAAEELDSTVGDIRGTTIPKAGPTGSHIDAINEGLNPTDNGHANTRKDLDSNIADVVARITKKPAEEVVETPTKKYGKYDLVMNPAGGFDVMLDGKKVTGSNRGGLDVARAMADKLDKKEAEEAPTFKTVSDKLQANEELTAEEVIFSRDNAEAIAKFMQANRTDYKEPVAKGTPEAKKTKEEVKQPTKTDPAFEPKIKKTNSQETAPSADKAAREADQEKILKLIENNFEEVVPGSGKWSKAHIATEPKYDSETQGEFFDVVLMAHMSGFGKPNGSIPTDPQVVIKAQDALLRLMLKGDYSPETLAKAIPWLSRDVDVMELSADRKRRATKSAEKNSNGVLQKHYVAQLAEELGELADAITKEQSKDLYDTKGVSGISIKDLIEVQKRVFKVLRFGASRVNKDTGKTNREQMIEAIKDLKLDKLIEFFPAKPVRDDLIRLALKLKVPAKAFVAKVSPKEPAVKSKPEPVVEEVVTEEPVIDEEFMSFDFDEEVDYDPEIFFSEENVIIPEVKEEQAALNMERRSILHSASREAMVQIAKKYPAVRKAATAFIKDCI